MPGLTMTLHPASDDGQRQRLDCGIDVLERPGPGPTLLFLHGIGSNAASFAPLFAVLPQGPRLIAWDAPGYLGSAPLPQTMPTADDYASRLPALLDDLGVDRIHLVGHSLGTLIAAAFASRAPQKVASLTLMASAQGHGRHPDEPLGPKAAQRLDDLKRLGPAAFAASRAARLIHDPARNPDAVARVEAEMARINPAGYAQAVNMLASGNLSKAIAQVSLKPGFIIGAGDLVTPMDQTQAALGAWAAVHGETPPCLSIPEAGHAVYVQNPRAVAAALMTLVPDLAPAPPQQVEGGRNGG